MISREDFEAVQKEVARLSTEQKQSQEVIAFLACCLAEAGFRLDAVEQRSPSSTRKTVGFAPKGVN
jgi:hypothetical protein